MSRRARRRKSGGTSSANGRWAGKLLIGLVVLLLLFVSLSYISLRMYLHSDGFRKFLSVEVSKAAQVNGAFSPFIWDGLAVETQGFDAEGEGLIAALKADVVMTEVGLGGVRRGVWELTGTRINRLSLNLREIPEEIVSAEPVPVPQVVAKPKQSRWLPSEVELGRVNVQDLTLRADLEGGEMALTGSTLLVEPASGKHAYRMELSGGRLVAPQEWVPELGIGRVSGTWRDGQAFINSLTATAWENGRIEAAGEVDTAARRYAFEGNVDGLKCEDLLDETWSRRLTGDVESSFSADNFSGELVVGGDLVIRNGVMTALPVLDALAAYADTRRFRILHLNDARTTWRWKDGELSLSNFVMASEGLVRVEGAVTIRGEELDGRFMLGLAPGTLANIPGAETHVFQPGERGLMWTPLRLTGTLSQPKEDLTDRLIEAAGLRMFDVIPETGERVLKFTRNMFGENPADMIDKGTRAIEKGTEVLEKGSEVIKDASGILESILGRGRRGD